MISIDDGNITIEGQLGDLIMEAARLMDAVASTIEKKSDEEELTYNFVVESILEFLAHMASVNHEENLWDGKEEIKFFQAVAKLRHKNKDEDDFVDFDSGTQEPNPGKNSYGKPLKDTTSISGGVKLAGDDFYFDPRMSKDDLMDIDVLKKLKKNK